MKNPTLLPSRIYLTRFPVLFALYKAQVQLSQYNPMLFNFARLIKLAEDWRIYNTYDIDNWALSCPSFWANSNVTVFHPCEASCTITPESTVVFLTKSINIVQSLQTHTSTAESRRYKFFLIGKIVMARTLDSYLILKVEVSSFMVLDAIHLIFISDNLIFL